MKNWKDNSAIQVWDLDNHFHSAFMEYGVQQRNMYLVRIIFYERGQGRGPMLQRYAEKMRGILAMFGWLTPLSLVCVLHQSAQ